MKDGMHLGKGQTIVLALWYAIIVLVAGTWTVLQAIEIVSAPHEVDDPLGMGFRLGIPAAASGCGLYYVRKLYKALLNYTDPPQRPGFYASTGTFLYFFARPFFAIIASVVLTLASVLFVHGVTGPDTHYSVGFPLFIGLTSLALGIVTGQSVRVLERRAGHEAGKLESVG